MKKLYKGMIFLLLPFLLISGCKGKNNATVKKQSAYSVQLTATVKDLSPPTIQCDNKFNVQLDEKINWNKRIRLEDNLDPAPTYKIEGKVDQEHSGTYPVTIKATDSSGNISRKKITVYVIDKTEKTEAVDNEKNKEQGSTNTQKSKQETNTKEHPSASSQPIPVPTLESKNFPFRQDVSRDVIYQECMSYVEAQLTGRSGKGNCTVIDDANGTHIGYQALFN